MQITTAGDAYRALREHIAAVQAEDPLAPVTVLVPSFAAGRDVLRHLAAHGGAVGVTAVTLTELAHRLAGGALAPRRPETTPVTAAAVRAVLADAPGVFAEVADQPGTVAALTRACAWLGGRNVTRPADADTVITEVLRIHDAVAARLARDYYAPAETIARAADRLPLPGHTVVFLPSPPVDTLEQDLHAQICARATVIDLSGEITGTAVLHASDPDDEVRTVVRAVREQILAGTAPHRIGVFFAADAPYGALVARHLDAAEIPWYGADPHAMIDRSVARSVLRLVAFRPGEIDRAELSAILDAGAVRWMGEDGARLSPREFDRLTCLQIPIVGGPDWARLADPDPAELPASMRDSVTASAARVTELITALEEHLTTIHTARSWTQAAEALTEMTAQLMPTIGRVPEQRAHLEAAIAGLAGCDAVGAPIGPDAIHAALTDQLAGGRGTCGTESVGVRVGDLADGAGRDLDAVFVLGMAEGHLPAARREDPLLPTELTGVDPADRLAERRRQTMRTLASGAQVRMCSFPRGDLRGGGEKVPSRWLLPTLDALTGAAVDQVGWERGVAGCAAVIAADSFAGGLLTPAPGAPQTPATDTEWRVRRYAATRDAIDGMPDTVTDALVMRADRRAGRFTRFTGAVGESARHIRLFDTPVAPTRLEEWATSPYLFFLQRILRAQVLPEPDEDVQIDALVRGDLVHDVLEQYILAGLDEGDAPDGHLLTTLAEQACQAAYDAAPGWLPQLWDRDRAAVLATLEQWFARDVAERAAGWTPIGAEQEFTADEAVRLDIGAEAIAFTGKIDRIDRHTDGRVRVTDYKTGSDKRYSGIDAGDPTGQGTHFQLPVYGLYAQSIAGGAEVEVRYQFLRPGDEPGEIGYPITGAVIDRLRADVAAVYQAVTTGMFPLKPGSFATREIENLLGPAELARTWEKLRHRPELAGLAALAEKEH